MFERLGVFVYPNQNLEEYPRYLLQFSMDISFQYRFHSNTTVQVKDAETESATSKESIAQTTEQPPAAPTMAPTIQPSTVPEADQVDVNKSESADSWQNNLEKDSIDKEGSKPDLKPFKDEVEEDAVVAENEADRVALLHEAPEMKENKTEGVINEEGSGVIYSEETPSDSEVLNVSPPRPRPKLVTPFRGRCPVCRKYLLDHSVQ